MHHSTPGAEYRNGHHYKVVEEIVPGDLVLAKNEDTGELLYSKVQQTFIRSADRIYQIRYADGTLIETTWSHPFYVKGKGWIQARYLRAGDIGETASGADLMIQSVAIDPRYETVYNFEVQEHHNYFVSEAGVLVHNDGGCGDAPGGLCEGNYCYFEDEDGNLTAFGRGSLGDLGYGPVDFAVDVLTLGGTVLARLGLRGAGRRIAGEGAEAAARGVAREAFEAGTREAEEAAVRELAERVALGDAGPNFVGQLGERLVRLAHNIGPKKFFDINGRRRIADGLDESAKLVTEVKNVRNLPLTRQLRDYMDFARTGGYRFQLFVRGANHPMGRTQLSDELLRHVREGRIILREIPPIP